MYQEIIRLLKQRRLYLKLTIEEVSDKIGVSTQNVGKWERQDCEPNAENFINWCEALGLYINLSAEAHHVDYFLPSDEIHKNLETEFGEIDYETEYNNFRDYYKSQNKSATDWESLLRKWLRNATIYKRERVSKQNGSAEFVQERRRRLYEKANIRDQIPTIQTRLQPKQKH